MARAELGVRIGALEQELKQKQGEAERSIGAEARRKLDLAKLATQLLRGIESYRRRTYELLFPSGPRNRFDKVAAITSKK